MLTLVAESFAPWSEKARWALDHHRIRYDYHEHLPLVGEPWLRLRLGTLTGRVSTPTLLTDGGHYGDSFAIAAYAEEKGGGPPLFPADRGADIAAWNARSEAALAAGRVGVIARMSEVPGAKTESLPLAAPAVLQPLVGLAAGATLAFLRWKYGVDRDVAAADRALRGGLEDLRSALAGRDYLFDRFSYADITMAVILQMVRPVSDAYIRLGPAAREVWTKAPLAEEFGDLIAWRDGLYARHRRPPPP